MIIKENILLCILNYLQQLFLFGSKSVIYLCQTFNHKSIRARHLSYINIQDISIKLLLLLPIYLSAKFILFPMTTNNQIKLKNDRKDILTTSSDDFLHPNSFIQETDMKKKTSRASVLFNEMQKLTNKIKVIDNKNQKKILEKMQIGSNSSSIQSNLGLRIIQDSIHVLNADNPSSKSLLSTSCRQCRKKQQSLNLLSAKIKKIQKEMDAKQKQISYLQFQLGAVKQQSLKLEITENKMLNSSTKMCLRKLLQKFMQDAVILSMASIQKSITNCYKNIDRIEILINSRRVEKPFRSSAISLSTIKQKSVCSETINIKKSAKSHNKYLVQNSSSSRISQKNVVVSSKNLVSQFQTIPDKYNEKVKNLEWKLNEKDVRICLLQKQLQSVKINSLEIEQEYALIFQNVKKSASENQAQLMQSFKSMKETSASKIRQLQEKIASNVDLKIERQKLSKLEKQLTNYKKQILSLNQQINKLRENDKNFGVVIKMKQRIDDLQMQLDLVKSQRSLLFSGDNLSYQIKNCSFQKRQKMFEENCTKLKEQIQRLNDLLRTKQVEIENISFLYKNKLAEYEIKKIEGCELDQFRNSKTEGSENRGQRQQGCQKINIQCLSIQEVLANKEFNFQKIRFNTITSQTQFFQRVFQYIKSLKICDNLQNFNSFDKAQNKEKLSQISQVSEQHNDDKYSRNHDKKKVPLYLMNQIQFVIGSIEKMGSGVTAQLQEELVKLKVYLQQFQQFDETEQFVASDCYNVGGTQEQIKIVAGRLCRLVLKSKDLRYKQIEDTVKSLGILLKVQIKFQ